MQLRNFAVNLFVAAAVMASAQAGPNQAMVGEGTARGEHGLARFSVHAFKNEQGQIRGSFRFLAETRNPARRVYIQLAEARGFNTRENAGVIEGPAVMKVREANGQVHDLRGQLRVQGVDLIHNPPGGGGREAGDVFSNFKPQEFGFDGKIPELGNERGQDAIRKDRLTVRFRSEENNVTYEFAGNVMRGFIEVRGAHN